MNAKEKKEGMVLAIGVVVLASLLIYVNKPHEKRVESEKQKKDIPYFTDAGVATASRRGAEETQGLKQTGYTGKEISIASRGQVRYTGRVSKDPTDNSVVMENISEVSGNTEKEEAVFRKQGFLVSAVFWGSKRPQAIINDKIVDIGEALDGGKVVGIDKKGVHVSFSGKEVILTVE